MGATSGAEGPQAVRYFEYDESRGHQVAARILGAEFDGNLVSDFCAAYNLIASLQQRCWAHLLRAIHEFKETHVEATGDVKWAAEVGKLCEDAQDWRAEHSTVTDADRQAEYHELWSRAGTLGLQNATSDQHPWCAVAKRVVRHQDELFLYGRVPILPADNLAARSLCPLVVIRQVSGNTRSTEGLVLLARFCSFHLYVLYTM